MSQNVAGIILAGGKSSRMGHNKALLPLRGERLVDYAARIIKNAGISDIYVSGEVEGYHAIPDLLPDRGPVGGICSAMHNLGASYTQLLFVPVDMPLISADCVKHLIAFSGKHEAQFFNANPIPCTLQVNEQVLEYTQNIYNTIANGTDISVKRYLSGINALELKIPPEYSDQLFNANTPEEWRRIEHECTHQ